MYLNVFDYLHSHSSNDHGSGGGEGWNNFPSNDLNLKLGNLIYIVVASP